MRRSTLAAAAALLQMSLAAAQAAPRTLTFDGHTLTEHRRATTANDAFVEFTRAHAGTRETLLIRRLDGRSVKDELKKLTTEIHAHHPDVKLKMFEKSAGQDSMVLYLLTPDKGDPSLVLWRLTQSGPQLIVATYELDFPLDDEAAIAQVSNHTAERAFSRLDPAELKQLLPEAE